MIIIFTLSTFRKVVAICQLMLSMLVPNTNATNMKILFQIRFQLHYKSRRRHLFLFLKMKSSEKSSESDAKKKKKNQRLTPFFQRKCWNSLNDVCNRFQMACFLSIRVDRVCYSTIYTRMILNLFFFWFFYFECLMSTSRRKKTKFVVVVFFFLLIGHYEHVNNISEGTRLTFTQKGAEKKTFDISWGMRDENMWMNRNNSLTSFAINSNISHNFEYYFNKSTYESWLVSVCYIWIPTFYFYSTKNQITRERTSWIEIILIGKKGQNIKCIDS